jgi:ABC-2 type transport system ATP-binding protein
VTEAISAADLTKRYGEMLALDGLDLSIEQGEVYGYLGPNGAGKTTTIRLLLGLHRPSRGRAELFGIDAWGDPVTAHRRVAYVAGEPFLWPAMTSAETFEFLARLHGGTDTAYRDELPGASSSTPRRRCARCRRATGRRCSWSPRWPPGRTCWCWTSRPAGWIR